MRADDVKVRLACPPPSAAMHSEFARPPLDGSISVLPGFADFHAKHNPDREWARLASQGDLPYTSISYTQFADATHRVAQHFRPDRTHAKGEVVALLIHCDTILYVALFVGLIRAGFVVSEII
jgi:acyl-CoA synthetase (AMP-forming)/AMP-acid ligase II